MISGVSSHPYGVTHVLWVGIQVEGSGPWLCHVGFGSRLWDSWPLEYMCVELSKLWLDGVISFIIGPNDPFGRYLPEW